MDHVEYIDKTQTYYRSQGYTRDYAWAENDTCAFTPLAKPLRESRIGLVSTASLVRLDDAGDPLES